MHEFDQPTPPPMIVSEDEPKLNEPAKKAARRSGPKWETDARERLRSTIRRYVKPLNDLREKDANEADTRLRITDFLREGLGFTLDDLDTEYRVRGDFADYGVRIDGDLIAFIECKRIKTKLAAKQLRQVEMYAVNEGVEWAILTNSVQWQVFHLGTRTPIEIDLALDVDLLSDQTLGQKTDELFYLTRESLKRRQIDELWQARKATSPKSLAAVLASEPVAEAIRRELRRRTGQRVEGEEIARLLRETVIRPDCLE